MQKVDKLSQDELPKECVEIRQIMLHSFKVRTDRE